MWTGKYLVLHLRIREERRLSAGSHQFSGSILPEMQTWEQMGFGREGVCEEEENEFGFKHTDTQGSMEHSDVVVPVGRHYSLELQRAHWLKDQVME